MSLEVILSRIAGGEDVPAAELLPYLCLESREQRAEVNARLAGACRQSGRADYLRHAGVFVRRAWLLGGFPPDLLPLYVDIHAALDDVDGIREAYKRAGMSAAARGDVSEALHYFDQWQYAYHTFQRLDRFEYDFDILDCVDRLARPHVIAPPPRPDLLAGGKVRVAYLMKGVNEVGSVLVKINLFFARYHDRSRVEPMFFVPESGTAVMASESGRKHARLFEDVGCKLVTAPDLNVAAEQLRAVARTIAAARPDILVTGAALAEFQHYYIASLRPAPFIIGQIQGPPPQFAPPLLDYGIAWSKHPLIDSPVGCPWLPIRWELPERDKITPHDRGELGLPDDAFVVATAGRHVKYQEPAFWQAVIDLLRQFPRMHYLPLGVEAAQLPFLPPLLAEDVRPRVHFLSWRDDSYLRALRLAEVFIDTFPSGGGATLLDALALGIPAVSFENNYMRLYDQTDWSLADELINIPELIVPRGDFEQMKRVVARLITDPEYRRDAARRAQEHTRATRTNPAQSVRECEDIYLQFLRQRLAGESAADPRAGEVEALGRPRGHRPPPEWVASAAYQLKRVLRYGVRQLDRVA